MNARPWFRLAFVVAALASTGARAGDPPRPFQVTGPVAMAPFENLSENRDAAGVLAWMLDGAMRQSGVRMAGELSPGLFGGRLATPLELQQAAAGLGAQWTLSGTILEYGYREATISGDPREPIVSLDLRLVSVTSGEIAWQQTFSASSHKAERRRSLAAVAQGIAAEVGIVLGRGGAVPGEASEAMPIPAEKKPAGEPEPAPAIGEGKKATP